MKKRKDGRYAQQVVIGKKPRKNPDGSPRLDAAGQPVMVKDVITVYGRSPKEVDSAITQVKIGLGKGIDVKAANDNFSLWADRFTKKKEAQQVSASYLVQIKNDQRHLEPLNIKPISKITVGDIQAIIDGLAVWHNGRKPLAKRSLKSIKVTARQIFELAIESRVIEYNPARYVTIPDNAAQQKREALTDEQQQWVRASLLVKSGNEMVQHRARRAAMIMMFAGLRRGELLALTWADVDLKNKTIRVQKAVEFVEGKPQNKQSTKTVAGMRTVDIPDVLVDYLTEERATDNHFYVVHKSNGQQLTESGWNRLWESYMSALNIAYGYKDDEKVSSVHHPKKLIMKIQTFTAHQLRHTFCTMMYLAGVDILTARDQMGHREIKTTLQIYSHLDSIYKRKSINKLNEYIGQSENSQAAEN